MKWHVLFIVIFIFSCEKMDDSIAEIDSSLMENGSGSSSVGDFTNQKLLFEGEFQNSSRYKVSGKAKVYEDKDKVRHLVIENLKSDAGPDLKIYLAKDKMASGFTEVSSKAQNGNATFKLSSSVDLAKQPFVLIWCKQFSVLFGHAELK